MLFVGSFAWSLSVLKLRTGSTQPEMQFRLARRMPLTYTYSFHALGCASVAQRQSTGFVNQWLWVQIPPLASLAGRPSFRHGAIDPRLLDAHR